MFVWEEALVRDATYPYVEVEVLVRDRLDVEPYGRYRRHDFSDLDSSQLPAMLVLDLPYTLSYL